MKDSQFESWEVFIQSKSGLPHIHAGSVHASDLKMAIQNARDTYTRRSEGISIWVIPTRFIGMTNPNDNDMLFESALSKQYRHPTFYVMPEGAKNI